MDERLREKIADIIVEREDESPLERADAILQIPEIKEALAAWRGDPGPSREELAELRASLDRNIDETLRRL